MSSIHASIYLGCTTSCASPSPTPNKIAAGILVHGALLANVGLRGRPLLRRAVPIAKREAQKGELLRRDARLGGVLEAISKDNRLSYLVPILLTDPMLFSRSRSLLAHVWQRGL